MPPLATILAVGAQTPLGLDACQTGMLFRAGYATMDHAPLGLDGEPVTLSRTAAIDETLTGADRLLALAEPALDAALADEAATSGPVQDVRLILGLDDALDEAVVERVAGVLLSRVRRWFDGARLEVVRGGAGSEVPAAQKALERGRATTVIWGGVHSDHDPWAIARLVAQDRLYADDNLDATLPGEAAAFVRLAGGAWSDGLATVIGLGHGVEAARPDNDLPSAPARGITAALRDATADMESAGEQVGWVVTDVGLEAWRLREWQTLTVRARPVVGPPYRYDNPAQRMGRLGAAGMPLGVALVTEGFRRGWAPSTRALVFGGSDGGARGAAALAAAEGSR